MSDKQEVEWIAFYSPDGRLIAAYTKQGTFPGECQNTIEMLAAEDGYRPDQITIRVVKGNEL